MPLLPASNVKKLTLENAGEIRISATAVTIATEAAAEYLRRLGERAAVIARGSGRKTIMDEDIENARHQVG